MIDEEPDLDRALAELARRQVEIDAAHRALEARSVTGRSRDHLVTVHARVLGGVSRIVLDPDVFEEHDERSLADALLEALTEASTASSEAFEAAFGELMTLPAIDAPATAAPTTSPTTLPTLPTLPTVTTPPAELPAWRPAPPPAPEPDDVQAAAVAVAAWATATATRAPGVAS